MSWRSVPVTKRTIFGNLNNNFVKLQEKNIDSFPEFKDSNTLLIGSDYSGEASGYPYLVYSFLFISLESWSRWEQERLSIRKRVFTDGRRISFKNLGDVQRKKALVPILQAANNLNGLSFSVAINKKAASLFDSDVPLDLNNKDFVQFKKWKKDVLEKAFTAVHFIGIILAGLAQEKQNVLWFTDVDNIAANNQRIRELTQIFAWISSQYLTFDLGHLRCGTTRCDNGTNQIEDFLAIPDLVAGALSEQLMLNSSGFLNTDGVFWINRPDYSDKTKIINWWFADSSKPLKKMFYIVDPSEDGITHRSSFFHFFNQ